MPVKVYVSLGSNIEPERNLREALRQLESTFGPLEHSRVYRSPPYGFAGDDFLNMVVGFESDATPAEIDAALSRIEDAAGRRSERRGSRTLDLDFLLYGRRVDARQRLPRTDVLEYPFTLAPLAELAPVAVHPVTGEPFGRAWRRMAARGEPLALVGALE